MKFSGLHVGIIGAGGFASFAAQSFARVPGVKLVAVTDIIGNAALKMGRDYGMKVYDDYEEMIVSDDIDLIYIATPPFLHWAQSKNALLAGKHVICEKPAAINANEAEELVKLARSLHLLYVVNLMQRYNPIFTIVRTIIKEKILGNFLHGFFENYASDQNLGPAHWFWDESKSGGIFIEHGVHFFDLFEGWFGAGRVVGAWQLYRPDRLKTIVDRAQATVRYDGGLVNFYHGFDQPGMLDRQEMRLEFERGEINLYEWVPVKMKLYGLLEPGQLQKLQKILPEISILRHELQEANQTVIGRFSEFIVADHVTLIYENILRKQELYQEVLCAMLMDQMAWIGSRDHQRIIDDNNGVRSLHMAIEANRMAKNFNY